MTPKSNGPGLKRMKVGEYLHESLVLLVRLAGIAAVREALSQVEANPETVDAPDEGEKPIPSPPRPWLPRALVPLEQAEPQKFDVLRSFFTAAESGGLLPEPEDVRRFAEKLGLKQLRGSKRRELLSSLAEPMSLLSVDRIQHLVGEARGISAEERSKGYSILTDKLLEGLPK